LQDRKNLKSELWLVDVSVTRPRPSPVLETQS
jgi:hypothetical protein